MANVDNDDPAGRSAIHPPLLGDSQGDSGGKSTHAIGSTGDMNNLFIYLFIFKAIYERRFATLRQRHDVIRATSKRRQQLLIQ